MSHRTTTIALAALSAAVVAAFAVPAASAAPAALQRATNKCWLDVINDWLDNNHVDKIYAPPCYTQAIQHLSALPDVSGYSSAIDDIHRAQLAAIHQQQNGGGGGPSSGGGAGPTSGGNSGPGSGNGGAGAGKGGGDTGTSTPGGGGVGGIGGPTDATSVPLPLIILGALAVLLALAGLATWGARRFQTRRPAPAPAVPRRR